MKKKKVTGRKRIYGFTFKTTQGYTQGIYENDFYQRKDFLKERQSFKKQGVRIKDKKTSKPFVPYRNR